MRKVHRSKQKVFLVSFTEAYSKGLSLTEAFILKETESDINILMGL